MAWPEVFFCHEKLHINQDCSVVLMKMRYPDISAIIVNLDPDILLPKLYMDPEIYK